MTCSQDLSLLAPPLANLGTPTSVHLTNTSIHSRIAKMSVIRSFLGRSDSGINCLLMFFPHTNINSSLKGAFLRLWSRNRPWYYILTWVGRSSFISIWSRSSPTGVLGYKDILQADVYQIYFFNQTDEFLTCYSNCSTRSYIIQGRKFPSCYSGDSIVMAIGWVVYFVCRFSWSASSIE